MNTSANESSRPRLALRSPLGIRAQVRASVRRQSVPRWSRRPLLKSPPQSGCEASSGGTVYGSVVERVHDRAHRAHTNSVGDWNDLRDDRSDEDDGYLRGCDHRHAALDPEASEIRHGDRAALDVIEAKGTFARLGGANAKEAGATRLTQILHSVQHRNLQAVNGIHGNRDVDVPVNQKLNARVTAVDLRDLLNGTHDSGENEIGVSDVHAGQRPQLIPTTLPA